MLKKEKQGFLDLHLHQKSHPSTKAFLSYSKQLHTTSNIQMFFLYWCYIENTSISNVFCLSGFFVFVSVTGKHQILMSLSDIRHRARRGHIHVSSNRSVKSNTKICKCPSFLDDTDSQAVKPRCVLSSGSNHHFDPVLMNRSPHHLLTFILSIAENNQL